MNIFSVLLLLFIMIPVIEIYLFIQVGGVIGAPSTIALVIVTAIVGAALLRQQGLSTLMRVRTEMDRGQIPAMAMMEGVVLLICGAFLLTPGFFTDAVGFLGLIPFTRRALLGVFMAKGVVRVVGGGPRGPHAPGRGFGTGPGAGPQAGPTAGGPRRPGPAQGPSGQGGARQGGVTLDGEYRREDD